MKDKNLNYINIELIHLKLDKINIQDIEYLFYNIKKLTEDELNIDFNYEDELKITYDYEYIYFNFNKNIILIPYNTQIIQLIKKYLDKQNEG